MAEWPVQWICRHFLRSMKILVKNTRRIYNHLVKQSLIIFLFLVSFVSARAAELKCLCFEDTISLSGNSVSKSTSVESAHHHNDATSSNEKDHQDHCQHTCSQCHFAAVIPLKIIISNPESFIQSGPLLLVQTPQDISLSVYRPPIA